MSGPLGGGGFFDSHCMINNSELRTSGNDDHKLFTAQKDGDDKPFVFWTHRAETETRKMTH